MAAPELTIVIPARDEAAKIGADVAAVAEFFAGAGLAGELIVVDDGSRDGTAAVAEAARPPALELLVLRLGRPRGKGAAVREGVGRSRGGVVLFCDSGGCIPLAAALPWIAEIRSGELDAAHGSRKLPQATIVAPQSWFRRLGSRLFMGWVHRLLGLGGTYTDTQCGFKLYRGDLARELFAACRTEGFLFDVEILIRARRRGARVAEFPVRWRCDRDSRLRPLRAGWRSLREAWRLRRLLREEARGPQRRA